MMGGLYHQVCTSETAVELVLDAVLLVVKVVHDGRED